MGQSVENGRRVHWGRNQYKYTCRVRELRMTMRALQKKYITNMITYIFLERPVYINIHIYIYINKHVSSVESMIATIAKSLVQCLKFLQVYSADLSCLHVSHPKIENKYIPRYLYIHAYTFTIYFTCDYNIYSYHYQFCEIVLYFISMCTYIFTFTYILSKFNLQFFLHHSSNPPKKTTIFRHFFSTQQLTPT